MCHQLCHAPCVFTRLLLASLLAFCDPARHCPPRGARHSPCFHNLYPPRPPAHNDAQCRGAISSVSMTSVHVTVVLFLGALTVTSAFMHKNTLDVSEREARPVGLLDRLTWKVPVGDVGLSEHLTVLHRSGPSPSRALRFTQSAVPAPPAPSRDRKPKAGRACPGPTVAQNGLENIRNDRLP